MLPTDGCGLQQPGSIDDAALPTGQSLIQFDRPGLLEQVDHGVAVRSEAEQSAGAEQCGRRTDPVAQIPFGGGTEAHPGGRGIEIGEVIVGEMGGVYRGGAWPEHAGILQHGGRGTPVHGQALLDLGLLLGRVHVQRSMIRVCPVDHCGHVFDRNTPHRVQRRTDQQTAPAVRLGTQGFHPFGPPFSTAVAEAQLRAVLQWCAVGSRTEIAGVEQGQPQAGIGCTVDQACPIAFGSPP